MKSMALMLIDEGANLRVVGRREAAFGQQEAAREQTEGNKGGAAGPMLTPVLAAIASYHGGGDQGSAEATIASVVFELLEHHNDADHGLLPTPPLALAAALGLARVVEVLLRASPDTERIIGGSAPGKVPEASEPLKKSGVVEAVDDLRGLTALGAACANGHAGAARVLLTHGSANVRHLWDNIFPPVFLFI
jgi:hypothetical protein